MLRSRLFPRLLYVMKTIILMVVGSYIYFYIIYLFLTCIFASIQNAVNYSHHKFQPSISVLINAFEAIDRP